MCTVDYICGSGESAQETVDDESQDEQFSLLLDRRPFVADARYKSFESSKLATHHRQTNQPLCTSSWRYRSQWERQLKVTTEAVVRNAILRSVADSGWRLGCVNRPTLRLWTRSGRRGRAAENLSLGCTDRWENLGNWYWSRLFLYVRKLKKINSGEICERIATNE